MYVCDQNVLVSVVSKPWFLFCMLCLMFCTVIGLEGHLSNITLLIIYR